MFDIWGTENVFNGNNFGSFNYRETTTTVFTKEQVGFRVCVFFGWVLYISTADRATIQCVFTSDRLQTVQMSFPVVSTAN